MDYNIAVSIEQLISGADSLQAMAEDAGDALPESPVATADLDAGAGEDQTGRTGRSLRPQDDTAAAGQAASAALLGAVQQVGRTVLSTSDALRATAADYQATETQASELINKTIGRSLGELR